ncbi:DUF58 domain-containing protein [Microbacterium sp. YY-01]|uniref:DUF58 domain-containing protein n=1 Tax=Microbacterium sp. YY-01 TaxID=3421634 RepID=UPI003D17743B
MRRVTSRGLAVALTGVLCVGGGAMVGSAVVVASGIMLVTVVALAALWVVVAMVNVDVRREVSPRVFTVGDSAQVTLDVWAQTTGGRQRRVRAAAWHDPVSAPLVGEGRGELGVASIDSYGSEVPQGYVVGAARRGRGTLGPLRVTVTDPFGLVQRTRTCGQSTSVTVLPAIYTLDAGQAAASGGESAVTRRGMLMQHGADSPIPRPYAPGDSLRRVHWRATARHGEMMVRQEEQHDATHTQVVVDVALRRWLVGPTAKNHAELMDDAVTACASVTMHLADQGHRVVVLDSTGAQWGTVAGLDGRHDLLEKLAAVAPQQTQQTLVLERGSALLTVIIAGNVEASTIDDWARALGSSVVLLAQRLTPAVHAHARSYGWRAAPLTHDPAAAWQQAHSGEGSDETGGAATRV